MKAYLLFVFLLPALCLPLSADDSLALGLLKGSSEPDYLNDELQIGVEFALSEGLVTSSVLLGPDEYLEVESGRLRVLDGWEITLLFEWLTVDSFREVSKLPENTEAGIPIVAAIGPPTSGTARRLIDGYTLEYTIISHLATETGLTSGLGPAVDGANSLTSQDWFFQSYEPRLFACRSAYTLARR